MKSAWRLMGIAALAIAAAGCAGSPARPETAVPATPAALPSISAPAPAQAPAPVSPAATVAEGPARPELSEVIRHPLGRTPIFINLPDALPPPTSAGRPETPVQTIAGAPKGALPDIDAMPAAAPIVLPSRPLPPLPSPQPPSAAAAKAPPVVSPPPAGSAVKPAAQSAVKPSAQSAAKGAVPTPAAPKAAISTPPSTAPIVDPYADRPPDNARNVTVEQGTRIELPFDGTGWTYLGERDSKDGVLYESRRYEGAGLVFVLNPTKVGDYVLRFQRQDLLRGTTNEELVAVNVTPKTTVKPAAAVVQTAGNAGSAIGAAAGTSSPPAGQAAAGLGGAVASASTAVTPPLNAAGGAGAGTSGTESSSSGPPVASPPVAGPSVKGQPDAQAAFLAGLPTTPDGILAAAKAELAAGRVASCLAALDRFLASYPDGMDEVFFLYGVALEQNGPAKDVKRAYAYYKKLCDDYPASQYWDKAAERMAYIERHYFDIR